MMPVYIIEEITRKVISENKEIAYQYKNGDDLMFNLLFRETMEHLNYRCNPQDVKNCLYNELKILNE